MASRLNADATTNPDVTTGVRHLYKAMYAGGVPHSTLELVHLRASQINGCSACVSAGIAGAKKAGETDERLHAVVAWRETPYFTDAERAALALTEAATRLADDGDVSDEVYAAAAAHYDELGLQTIVLMIATTNFFNRINKTFRVPAGTTWG